MPIITLKPSKPMPISLQGIYARLKEISDDVEFRWSRRGVPHIIVAMSNGDYSVCYFGKYRSYRVFFPYPGEAQFKWDTKDPASVIKYIDSQQPKNRKLRSDGSVEEDDYPTEENRLKYMENYRFMREVYYEVV